MRASRVHDTAEFLERTLAMRTADPVHLNVIGSVATGVLQGRTYDELHWFLIEDDDGTVVGAGAWTVPYHVLVSPMPDDAAHELGRLLAALPTPPVAVVGPPDVCFGVAAGSGFTPKVAMRERILVLGEFTPAVGVPGVARPPADDDDVELAVEWTVQFAQDADAELDDPRQSAESRLPGMLFWEVDGEPVAMASHAPLVTTPAGTVARIGPVFTAREHRRRGYGAAVTSAVVASVLDRPSTIMLFADAANPTSNGVYERLGFAMVDEILDVDLLRP